MADIVWFVFSVSGFACCVIAGFVWRRLSRSAAPRHFLFFVAALYLVASLYPVDRVAARILSYGFHPLERSDVPFGTTVEVVLGSGSFTARDWKGGHYSLVDSIGAMRIVEAARVYRLIDPAWVISSGGGAGGGATTSIGAMMRDDLVRLGVPDSRILLETQSQTTRDEAVAIEEMLRSLHAAHVILVTSDVHMRRSIGAFRAVGVETIPAIARDVFIDMPAFRLILPSGEGLAEAGQVTHEAGGIIYYGIRGWFTL